MARKVLGRGLGALIPSRQAEEAPRSAPAAAEGSVRIPIERILPNPRQPRKAFDEESLEELSRSIRSRGLIQPVVVRPLPGGRYELIAGERRWRAARLAGVEYLPAVIREADTDETLELALIENIQREDLNPIDTALAYQQLVETFGLSHELVAERVGKNRASVTNLLRLLGLPEEVRAAVASGTLGMGHARAILAVPGAEGQLSAARTAIAKGLSARETERLARRLASPRKRIAKSNAKDIFIKELEDSIRRAAGTKVAIRHRGSRGVIELHYYSNEELERLASLLRGRTTA